MLGNLLSFLWDEVVNTIIYTLNICPKKIVEGKNPYEVWKRKKPNITHLRVFGFDTFTFIIF